MPRALQSVLCGLGLCALRKAQSASLVIPIVLVLLSASPAFAWLGPKTWAATPAIEAEWLFPASGPARVMWMFMAQPGRLSLRIWARDRDYWTASDQSHALTPWTRFGYEEDTLTYTWVAERGTIEGSGPSVEYVAKDKNTGFNLTPGPDTVTVTINDVGCLPPGDEGSRNDSPPFQSQLSIVVDNPGGPFRIVRILASGTTGAPATSGYNQQSDPSQRAYAIFSIGFLTSIRATTDFGTGTGNGTVSLLVPPDETHEMHTVTVRLPPNGTPLDEKQANFGLYFHHDCAEWSWQNPPYDEVPGGWDPNYSDPNWFQGIEGQVPTDRHWNWLIGANAQGVRYHWNLVDGTAIGLLDIYGNLGPAGTCYIGEVTQWSGPDAWKNHHFYQSEPSSSHLGWGWWWTGQQWEWLPDEIEYRGLDAAGMVVKHELEHKQFWESDGNWEGYGYLQIWEYDGFFNKVYWPYNPDKPYDRDADGVKDTYEEALGYPWRWKPADGEPWWKWAFSLYMAHNGVSDPPEWNDTNRALWADIEFQARWWGERLWIKQERVGEDWSDHGAQMNRH